MGSWPKPIRQVQPTKWIPKRHARKDCLTTKSSTRKVSPSSSLAVYLYTVDSNTILSQCSHNLCIRNSHIVDSHYLHRLLPLHPSYSAQPSGPGRYKSPRNLSLSSGCTVHSRASHTLASSTSRSARRRHSCSSTGSRKEFSRWRSGCSRGRRYSGSLCNREVSRCACWKRSGVGRGQIRPTSMRDLEDGPERFATLLALVRGVFGIFHLVGEFEEGVFDVVEAFGGRFAGAGWADGGHGGWLFVRFKWLNRW